MPIRVNIPEHGIAGISNGPQTEPIAHDAAIVTVIWKVKLPPLALPDQTPAIASEVGGCVAVGRATVGWACGFLVAVGEGVSVAGTAVVGSGVGEGTGVSLAKGIEAVRVILTASTVAVAV